MCIWQILLQLEYSYKRTQRGKSSHSQKLFCSLQPILSSNLHSFVRMHTSNHSHTCKSLTCTLSPSVAIMLASAAAIELRPTPELFLTPEPKPSDASKICAWGRVHPVLTVTRTNRSIYIARLCRFAKFCLFQVDSAYTKIPHLLPNCIRPCHFHVFDWIAYILSLIHISEPTRRM